MERIFVEKNDSAEDIAEKITASAEEGIVLVIPKGVEMRKHPGVFQLIKKEAAAAGKNVSVETVDEQILEMAGASGLQSIHPFFSGAARGAVVSDIVPAAAEREILPRSGRHTKGARKISPIPEEEVEAEKKEEEVLSAVVRKSRRTEEEEPPSGEFHQPRRSRRPFRFLKIGAITFFVALVLGGGLVVVHKFFYKASVVIEFQNTPWQYEGALLAAKEISKINIEDKAVPAEVFRMPKNITQFFRASGKQEVAQKATARILIYNAYSSEPQILVATTRFTDPDGKIFRLDSQVVVPGAQIQDGQIVPSSVEAAVTADKPGPAYNIGPVERLNIPGFKNSPKYKAFYGVLPEAAKGGFIGEKSVPTEADIAAAKDRTSEILKKILQDSLPLAKPEGFLVLEGASDIKINKLVVNKNTDADGNFSVLGEAELNAVAMQEISLRAILETIKNRDNPGTDFKELKMNYSEIKPDFVSGRVSFSLSADAILQPSFRADDFKNNLAGKKISEARGIILGLSGLSEAKISLWPFYAGYLPDSWNSMPKDAGRISITVK